MKGGDFRKGKEKKRWSRVKGKGRSGFKYGHVGGVKKRGVERYTWAEVIMHCHMSEAVAYRHTPEAVTPRLEQPCTRASTGIFVKLGKKFNVDRIFCPLQPLAHFHVVIDQCLVRRNLGISVKKFQKLSSVLNLTKIHNLA